MSGIVRRVAVTSSPRGRGGGFGQPGVLLLETLKLPEELVVFGVRNLGRVVAVVPVVVVPDQAPELLGAESRRMPWHLTSGGAGRAKAAGGLPVTIIQWKPASQSGRRTA